MNHRMNRRNFVQGMTAFSGVAILSPSYLWGAEAIELIDYHVHLDEVVTLEKALEISKARGVRFGIVQHAGNVDFGEEPVLHNDKDLLEYIAELEGKPVLKGIQAEGLDWRTCFSKEAVAKLDYVLSDALSLPLENGEHMIIWLPGVQVDDKEDFMERYTNFMVQVMAEEPIDILANPTFLPETIRKDYEILWTSKRRERIIEAALKYNVAIEINSGFRIPSLSFIREMKAAGVKFSFGSNIHGPEVGTLDYGQEMIREAGLTPKNVFTPAPAGKKPVELRTFS